MNGPSALPDPMACPSQKHKLNLTHTGLALEIMGTLVWDIPSHLFAGLCRVVAGRHLSVCTDGPKTSWAVAYPSQSLFLSPAWPPALGSPTKDKVRTVSACLPVSPPPHTPLEPSVSRATSGPFSALCKGSGS